MSSARQIEGLTSLGEASHSSSASPDDGPNSNSISDLELSSQKLKISLPHLQLGLHPPKQPHRASIYHARYRDSKDNIFFRMQSQPLSSSGMDRHDLSLDLSAVPSLHRQMRDPIIGELSEFESMCIHFFLTELPVNLGIHHLFPSFLGSIFSSSLWNKGLRSVVLAVSAYLLDSRAGRPALRAYKYMQQGIPLIQYAFSENIFDESLVFSLFLTAFLHQICGEIASSRPHLESLLPLLQHHGAIPPNRKDCSPELMLVWRLAIQMDHTCAFGDQNLIFPLVEKEDHIHRKWIEKLVDPSRPEMADWALAQFALDDMLSRSIIIMNKANQLRSMSTGNSVKSELAINAETEKLLSSHAGWMERPCIRSTSDLAEYNPNLYNTAPPSEDPTLKPFPLSSNIKIKNRGFGALMIQYYWISIYISFISRPRLGALPPERFEAAVNLCHIYEAIGCKETFGVCRVVLGLYLTGLTLGGKEYSEEFEWVGERLRAIDNSYGYRAGTTVWNVLRTTWRWKGSPWKHYMAGHNR